MPSIRFDCLKTTELKDIMEENSHHLHRKKKMLREKKKQEKLQDLQKGNFKLLLRNTKDYLKYILYSQIEMSSIKFSLI